MPLQATSGAASYDAFGGGVPVVPNYIEDVFSTWLYTGNGTSQTITNGINLSGKGGLVWVKGRSTAGQRNGFFDTSRGASNFIWSDSTAGNNVFAGYGVTNFGTSSFSLGDDSAGGYWVNGNNITYASWTFRKQPKFFDVVTWTGDGTGNRAISHSLASVPGCMILKRTDTATNWIVWHNSLPSTTQSYLLLNDTAQQNSSASIWGNTAPTSTNFTVGSAQFNASGQTYVAYLYASNAGGFGLTGLDNVISCGSAVMDASTGNATINLGYEPQFVLVKKASGAGNWFLMDSMRGYNMTSDAVLNANSTAAESSFDIGNPTSTGFYLYVGDPSATYIYIAIRRGPMKVPTVGTSVFSPTATTVASGTAITTGFVTDAVLGAYRNSASNRFFGDRLRGNTNSLITNATDAEFGGAGRGFGFTSSNTGFIEYEYSTSATQIYWAFQRAPNFFDEVCYTGNGTSIDISHNLNVRPELVITKNRAGVTGENWSAVYVTGSIRGTLSTVNAFVAESSTDINISSTTSTIVSYSGNPRVNSSGATYVGYLFATCAGVSKVGSYTGTGATQTINCGFGASGSRFVLVKRTDSTGDWYVWDSARGMVSGTDPSLLLNSTAAEVNANSVYAVSTGFQIVSTAAGINASGGSYIFLSVA